MSAERRIDLPVRGRSQADFAYSDGNTWEHFRDVLVHADGSVQAWDDVSETYTWRHDLTEEQMAEARRMAGL